MFERVEFVRNPGEYAVRGDIIDIYSPNEKYPLRVLFDFDEIESSLFLFDKILRNQKLKLMSIIYFQPLKLFLMMQLKISERITENSNLITKRNTIIQFQIKFYCQVQINFYPMIYDKYDSILEYLSNYCFLASDFENILKKTKKSLEDDFAEINSLFLKQNNFISNKSEIDKILKKIKSYFLYNYFFQ